MGLVLTYYSDFLGRNVCPLVTLMRAFRPIFKSTAPKIYSPLLPTHNFGLKPSHNRRLSTNSPSRARLTPLPPRPSSPPVLPSNPSLSQRLKQLIKSYGWYALGVYFILSAVDFGVAFVGVNLLGAEYVSRATASLKTMVTDHLYSKPAEPGLDEIESTNNPQATGGHEGLYAMLVLAYTIHKTLFLPLRVGLTAAFTPRLVAWLSQKGWAGSAGTRRAAQEMREKFREQIQRRQ